MSVARPAAEATLKATVLPHSRAQRQLPHNKRSVHRIHILAREVQLRHMLVIADAAEGSDIVVTTVEDRCEHVSLFLLEVVADDGNGDERTEKNEKAT